MKNADIQNLTDKELQEKVQLEKSNYQKLKFAHTISPLENPSQLKEQRKLVARLSTEISKRNHK